MSNTNIERATGVILPIMQRAMPSLFVNSIIGGPGLALLNNSRFKVTNGQYGKFTKLNNRKKTQKLIDLIRLYPHVNTMGYIYQNGDYDNWCKNMFGENHYICWFTYIFFSTNDGKTAFLLTWSK
jgi:hypothetical protein